MCHSFQFSRKKKKCVISSHRSLCCFNIQVAYPYVAKRLLTDPNPALRERLIQVTSQGLLNTTAKLLSIGSFYHMIHHCICESVE